MKTRHVVLFSTIVAATAAYVLYDKFGNQSGELPRPTPLPPATKLLGNVNLNATLPSTQKTVVQAKQTIVAPPADYEIVLPANIPSNLRPWTQQVLEEAKQKILSGENFNQLWTHGNLRVRLILSDKPFRVQVGNMRMNIGDGALAVDGGRLPTLNHIVETIDEMVTYYGRRIRYINNNGMMNGISGVDLLASALQP